MALFAAGKGVGDMIYQLRLGGKSMSQTDKNNGKVKQSDIPLESKPLLTLKEASMYTGIGINKLREISNERNCDFVLFVGRKRMFKREALLQFIAESYSV